MAENFRCWVALCCFSDIKCMWPWTHNNQVTYHCILETIQDLSFYGPHITPRAVGEPIHHHCFYPFHNLLSSTCRWRWSTSVKAWKRYVKNISNQNRSPRTSESRPWRILGIKSNKSITQWINHSNTKQRRYVFLLYGDSAYKTAYNVHDFSRKWLY